MFANLPSHPDIDFLLNSAAGIKPDGESLLKRASASEDRLSLAQRRRVTRLRSKPPEIAGLSGEELVRRVIEENDAQVYSFRWEVPGTEDDVLNPHLVLRMRTGNSNHGPVRTSMSGAAAIELWDRITSSIRLTPANSGKRPRVLRPRTSSKT